MKFQDRTVERTHVKYQEPTRITCWLQSLPVQAELFLGVRWVGEGSSIRGCEIPIEEPVWPGGQATLTASFVAPEEPGTYQLVFDLGLKHLWWFSERNPESQHTIPVIVIDTTNGAKGSDER